MENVGLQYIFLETINMYNTAYTAVNIELLILNMSLLDETTLLMHKVLWFN